MVIPVPGPQAYLILFLWPVVVAILFRKLPMQPAVIWSLLGAYLLLPTAWVVNVDMPLLPALEKHTLPAIVTVIFAALTLRRIEKAHQRLRTVPQGQFIRPMSLPGWLPRSAIGMGLFLVMIGGIFMSIMTNRDVLIYGDTVVPAMRLYDALSLILEVLVMLLPVFLGRKFLANDAGHRHLLTAMVVAAIGYSFLALYEIRMSPQLNNLVYGFFPHSWAQHIRGDGFRPLVFMDHGLVWAIFLSMSILAAATLARMTKDVARARYIMATCYLFAVLVLSKSLGALMITIVLLPVVLLMPVRLQLMAAAIIAGLSLSYPMLRGAHLIPTDAFVEIVATEIDPSRAQSLGFRFHHEDALLEKANERATFGWGGYTRWRIYDEQGNDLTVSDGAWIINIAQRGWVGYVAQFGFLSLPLILFFFRRKRYDVELATTGLCLIIAANLVDLLPNDSLSPLLWLAAGALLGRIELQRKDVAPSTERRVVKQHKRSAIGETPDPNVPIMTPHSRFAHEINKRGS